MVFYSKKKKKKKAAVEYPFEEKNTQAGFL